MNLTEHFTLEELTRSDTALRKGLDNTPGAAVIANLTLLAATLEQIRTLLGCPIWVSSGYRSLEVNASVGGSKTSAHCDGFSADFTAPEFGPPREVAQVIKNSEIPFDQLIYEGTWVHISIDPRLRGQVLTAHFAQGKVTYTAGIS